MDWFGNRKEESFEYRRVDRSDWSEGAAWPQVTGGTIELSALSDLKASGSLSFEGEAMPDERGVVRVYYSFADQHGERGEFALATLLFSCAEPSYDGAAVAGTLECSSVLRILQSKRYRFPFTVAAGTQAVQLAIGLVEGCGLRVNSPEATAYEVREDYTFDAGKTYLEIVNGLLDMAGFSACWPDAYGVVQMERRAPSRGSGPSRWSSPTTSGPSCTPRSCRGRTSTCATCSPRPTPTTGRACGRPRR